MKPISPDHHADAPVTEAEIRAVYLALMAVLGLGALDQSIVATALPRIVGDLGGLAHLSWVVTAYVLASTATMPLYGKLADQYGRRPMIFTALITFLVGSVLCGLAHSMFQLIVFRAIQGMGSGGFMPLAQIIIGDLVPPRERARRQGSIAIVFAVTSVLGPVLGGIMTDLLSWHWIFYINLPVGAVALYAIARSLRKPAATHAHRIDYLGSVLLTGAVTSLLLILALGGTEWPWGAPQIDVWAGLAVAVLAFAALAWGMGSGSGLVVIEPAIFMLGAGLGLVMPNMTVAVQNALPVPRRGVGTAMLTFFRSLGGLLGVTGSGAILAHQLHRHGISAIAAPGAHGAGGAAAPEVQAAAVEIYRHAIA